MNLRDDELLGWMRWCPGCREEWPFDSDFWHVVDGQLTGNEPPVCRACRSERRAMRRRNVMTKQRIDRRLPPPVPGRCNDRMKAGGRCGRLADHQHKHRSTYAMETDREASRAYHTSHPRRAA